MIRPGEEWGSPTDSPADLDVEGDDAALGRAIAAAPGALVQFHPSPTSDLARSVGLAPSVGLRASEPVGTALTLDALALDDGTLACNMCVLGTPPDRLRWSSRAHQVEVLLDGRAWFSGGVTTIVIATGQFLRGLDLVPRGHPGDEWAEVQLYEVGRRERRAMRARLATGRHVPHPSIHQRRARRVELRAPRGLACEADGVSRPPLTHLTIEVLPGAYRLLL